MSIKPAYMTATLARAAVPTAPCTHEAECDRLVPALKRTGAANEAKIGRTGR